jgi:hypothetical protein
MSVRSLARGLIRGVTWKNPMVNVIVHAADPVDYIVRWRKGRLHLPPYSIRVRSSGVRQDIGGDGFVGVGANTTILLRTHAELTPESKVLEIGCGCGRLAIGLADFLGDGIIRGWILSASRWKPQGEIGF